MLIIFPDHIPTLASKPQNIKDELKKITNLLKRISKSRLDKAEYDWIKTALLFRTGKCCLLIIK